MVVTSESSDGSDKGFWWYPGRWWSRAIIIILVSWWDIGIPSRLGWDGETQKGIKFQSGARGIFYAMKANQIAHFLNYAFGIPARSMHFNGLVNRKKLKCKLVVHLVTDSFRESCSASYRSNYSRASFQYHLIYPNVSIGTGMYILNKRDQNKLRSQAKF